MQLAPFAPHVEAAVPAWHTPLRQQPAQLVELHADETTHSPFWHESPLPHAVHELPFAPQKDELTPAWQVSPAQQPAQLLALHAAVPPPPPPAPPPVTTPPPPPPPPPAPPPVTTPPPPPPPPAPPPVDSGVHSPRLHAEPNAHSRHSPPSVPQALGVVPPTHTPAESQQPEHVLGEHFSEGAEQPTSTDSAKATRARRITPP